MANQRSIQEYQDAAGGFLRSSNWLLFGGNFTPVANALQALTNANLVYTTTAVPTVGTTTPATATYFLTTDVAVLTYQTSPGGSIQVPVPAPLAAMFGADGITVDPTNALVIALNAAIIGTLCDAAGNVVTAYKSGVKSSRRTEQNIG